MRNRLGPGNVAKPLARCCAWAASRQCISFVLVVTGHGYGTVFRLVENILQLTSEGTFAHICPCRGPVLLIVAMIKPGHDVS